MRRSIGADAPRIVCLIWLAALLLWDDQAWLAQYLWLTELLQP